MTGCASSEPLLDEPEEEEEEEAAEEEEDSDSEESDEDELGADEPPALLPFPAATRAAAAEEAAAAAPAARGPFSFEEGEEEEPLVFGAADFRRGLARGLRALALMPKDMSSNSSSDEEAADPESLMFPLGVLVPTYVFV